MNQQRDSAIVEYMQQPWAVRPEVLDQLVEIVARHAAGVKLPAEEIAAVMATRTASADEERSYQLAGSTAIIPIDGIIAKYSRMINGSSQPRGTSVEQISGQLNAALGDDRVRTIFLHIESPGGMISGVPDLADAVWEANQTKPVIAFADDMAASGAYQIGSQAARFYANQSAMVGCIGVYTVYLDAARWAEDKGFKFHIIRSGEHKGVGTLGVPITDRQLAAIQAEVDHYFAMFKATVLRGRSERGLTAERLDEIADGRVFIGTDAVKLDLIDGVKTLGQALTSARPRVKAPSADLSDLHQIAANAAEYHEQLHSGTQLKGQVMEGQDKQGTPPAGQAAPTDDQLKAAKSEAAAAERTRISAIEEALPGEEFAALRARARAEDLSVDAAKAAGFDLAVAERDRVKGDYDKLVTAIGREGLTAEKLLAFEASDEDASKPSGKAAAEAGTDDGQAETYDAAVKLNLDAGKPKAEAYRQASNKFPKSHEAWKKADAGRKA